MTLLEAELAKGPPGMAGIVEPQVRDRASAPALGRSPWRLETLSPLSSTHLGRPSKARDAREWSCRAPQREPTYEMAVAIVFGGALAGRDLFLPRWFWGERPAHDEGTARG